MQGQLTTHASKPRNEGANLVNCAALSHRAAGYQLKLLRGIPPRPEITIAYAYGDVVDRSEETIAELRELLA